MWDFQWWAIFTSNTRWQYRYLVLDIVEALNSILSGGFWGGKLRIGANQSEWIIDKLEPFKKSTVIKPNFQIDTSSTPPTWPIWDLKKNSKLLIKIADLED